MKQKYFALTVGEYLAISKPLPHETEIEHYYRKLSVIFKIPVEQIKGWPISKIVSYRSQLQEIENSRFPAKFRKSVKIGGSWFYVDHQITRLRADQFIDASHFSKTIDTDLHKFLACFLRPRKWMYGTPEEYNGSTHSEIAKLIHDTMTIEQAYPLMVFFCTCLEKLSQAIPGYLTRKIQKTHSQIALSQNGDGLQQ